MKQTVVMTLDLDESKETVPEVFGTTVEAIDGFAKRAFEMVSESAHRDEDGTPTGDSKTELMIKLIREYEEAGNDQLGGILLSLATSALTRKIEKVAMESMLTELGGIKGGGLFKAMAAAAAHDCANCDAYEKCKLPIKKPRD